MALLKKVWRVFKLRRGTRFCIVCLAMILCTYNYLSSFVFVRHYRHLSDTSVLSHAREMKDCNGYNNGQLCKHKKHERLFNHRIREPGVKDITGDSVGAVKSFVGNISRPSNHCVHHEIVAKHLVPTQPVACIPHKPSYSSCRYASMLYRRDDELKKCRPKQPVEICHLKMRSSMKDHFYECSLRECVKNQRRNVKIWRPIENGKELESTNAYTDASSLQKAVAFYAAQAGRQGTNFLFLECTDGKEREKYDSIAQLLLIPPLQLFKARNTSGNKKNKSKSANYRIDINVILLDSTARSHFYRSLPTVVETFNQINSDDKFPAEVLDFELFQSLHGHTAENLHALFTGDLFPKHWTNEERENVALGAEVLFNEYSDAGFHTLYQDDLCYDEWWGIRMDVGSPHTWDDFLNRLSASGIESTGLTHSSCYILNHNNVSNPFTGPPGPLCFNGRFHHDYYLDSLYQRHKLASRMGVPLFSYTGLHTGHDHTGKRVQSMDFDLSRFVRQMSRLPNTMTILLADHGNTYATYTHAVMEGRFEQFHPTFFLVLPDGVKEVLGREVVDNLRTNQKKLVTMLDIHHALMRIPTQLQPVGLFGVVDSNRSCDDLNLRLPNLCVCEGWDTDTLNDTSRVGIVNFAVGTLNNKILRYQQKMRANGSLPRCRRLVAVQFENVRERNLRDGLITSLDFHTVAGRGADRKTDIFHVEVRSTRDPSQVSFNLKLLSYDRVTKYGPYRSCADEGIDIRLCVCDMTTKQQHHDASDLETLVMTELLPTESKLAPSDVFLIHRLSISPCLYFRTTSILDTSEDNSIFSSSYEVANKCKDDITLRVRFALDNLKTSDGTSIEVVVLAYGVTYLSEVLRDTPYWSSTVLSVDYVVIPSTSVTLRAPVAGL